MRAVDLFCGCGGMSLGFQQAGVELMAAFENWPLAAACYRRNFSHQVSRFDIAFKKVSNKHIVIELKRGNRTLKRQELYEQISKYSEAMEKALAATSPGDQYEIIVLLGKPVEGWDLTSSSYQRFIDSLSSYRCRIMYYSELLANAESMYKDFLEKNEESSVLGKLIQRIDEDQ